MPSLIRRIRAFFTGTYVGDEGLDVNVLIIPGKGGGRITCWTKERRFVASIEADEKEQPVLSRRCLAFKVWHGAEFGIPPDWDFEKTIAQISAVLAAYKVPHTIVD